MAFVPILGLITTTTGAISTGSTAVPLPASFIATIDAALAPGDFTIFSINDTVGFEYIKCTGVSGNTALITRAQEGTSARAFGAGATLRFLWTTEGIVAVTNGGAGIPINVTGSGVAAVTGGPYDFNVDVPVTTLVADSPNVIISGTFPDFSIEVTEPTVTGVTSVTGSGTAVATPITGGFDINVAAGSLVVGPGGGIAITGTWPDYEIENTQTPGGTGTVLDVTAGTGISVTGTPAVNPVVGITPTGIAAGTYGGITVNTEGQITGISASLITGIASSSGALTVSGPAAGVVTLGLNDATTASAGIVQLAVNTSVASSDPADVTSAVTPSGVAAVVAALTGATVLGSGLIVPDPGGAGIFTNALAGVSNSLVLAAGQKALVFLYAEVVDTVIPANIPQFAIAVIDATATFINSNTIMNGNTRVLNFVIDGPYTGTLLAFSTALGVNEALSSYWMNVVVK